MINNKKTARIAGLWYLAFILLGVFSIMFVDDTLSVAGDAAATIANIRANGVLFCFGTVAYIAGYVCFILTANTLGKLFKSTDSRLTLMMRIFVFVGTAIVLVCKLVQLIAVITNAENLMAIYENGNAVAVIFWGLWLLPLGLLILKSNLIPKIIGILLLGACVGNLIDFTIYFFAPNTPEAVLNVCYIVGMLGEFGLVLWLLIKGVKVEK
ncbi:MAG: DUF4386 domain-containing protein [Dehalococcoidia bacterium]|nr:DUF4386 domain-containing protein [Dehalococcoidia bacterium]